MSSTEQDKTRTVVIAIPIAGGQLCMHFGHCEQFALLDVDTVNREILNSRQVAPPAHQPGVLPQWLHDRGVNLVIAGGMGRRAQDIFAEHGIKVLVGAPAEQPEKIVQTYLDGDLQHGENLCDH
ncbi:MAG: NifB/NifX family molybdenum-iron cluster-binding protein [Pirellulales bacterium]|nr:NifB/NifX family molybdenum-iron cluster-binding protein [Pirellulales bacterium]